MAQGLVPVFVNDARVSLQGDPKPKIAKIVSAAGKQPNMVEVYRVENQQATATEGEHLNSDDRIDRTQEENPIYLKCVEKGEGSTAGGGLESSAAQMGGVGAAPPSQPSPGERRPSGPGGPSERESGPGRTGDIAATASTPSSPGNSPGSESREKPGEREEHKESEKNPIRPTKEKRQESSEPS